MRRESSKCENSISESSRALEINPMPAVSCTAPTDDWVAAAIASQPGSESTR
jgi:hypothetical protein